MVRLFFITASISMALAVILGAFGAHSLKEKISPEMLAIFDTAVRYQIYHTLGIFIVAFFIHLFPSANISLSGWFFIFGIFLFSGSLYILAFTGIKWLGAVTPFGGLSFILGWLYFAWKTFKTLL